MTVAVITDAALWRPAAALVGTSATAHRRRGWAPACRFPQLVDRMIEAELVAA